MAMMISSTDLLKAQTQGSADYHEEAARYLPGGVTANIKYFAPYPIAMEVAHGAYIYDLDHNDYIDYNLCYGALLLGHGHPKVTKALKEQLARMGTTVFGAPHKLEVELAKKLVELYPGIDLVRYTNSGLEATLLAIRLAFAWTGKRKLAKFEGHYHGGYDQVLISVNPQERSKDQRPVTTFDSRGIPDYYAENTLVLPFNDLDQTGAILQEHRDELAAVIIEPVQGGFLPPNVEFLKGLRELTQRLGILLIFDEVKTGFRVGLSGAQGLYGVTPDLTALGKVLGGGFPIGAVGGTREIMEICSPTQADILTVGTTTDKRQVTDRLFHSGTYNGHPTVLAAGLATIQVLEEENTYQRLEEATATLRTGMEKILNERGIAARTVGVGTIFNLILSDEPVDQVQDVLRSDLDLRRELDYALLEQGIYLKPLNRFSLSTAHTPDVIAETLERFEGGVKRIFKK